MTTVPNNIITPQNVKAITVNVTTAKTNYADNSNAKAVVVSGSNPNGCLVKAVSAIPLATCAATQVQLYRSPDNGVTLFFYDSILYPATSVGPATLTPKMNFAYTETAPIRLQAGDSLWAAIGVALTAGFDVTAEIEAY